VDRPLDQAFTRQRTLRRLSWTAGTIAVALAALIWLPALVTPAISRGQVRIAAAEVGPIEAVISATGTVVPEVEQVISSPVDARVLRILKTAGATLHAGDPLVTLDVSETRLAVDKLTQDREIKANEQAQKRLALNKQLIDLDGQIEVKRLQLQSFRQQLERDRALSREGLLSTELFRKSELAVTQAEIELKQLEQSREAAQISNKNEVEGLSLQMAQLTGAEVQAKRTLDLASPRADRDGVLTWALTQEGAAIHKGDVIARIADLRSFRVDATVSDAHATELSAGLPVIVRVNDETLEGRISTVLPTIQNGVVSIQVALSDRAHASLRSNLRVDVLVVTARKPRVVRIKRGPFATGAGVQQVFVVRGDRGIRRPVRFGLASFDYFEVVDGLAPGESAIISDMSDYVRAKEVRIR